MDILKKFSIWMGKNYSISESSIGKYERAVNTVSNEMLEYKVIQKSLLYMNATELDLAIMKIFNNDYFIDKNSRGNNMYSSSIKKFRLFVFENSYIEEPENDQLEKLIGKDLEYTEKESLIKARLGQGIFRRGLLKRYDGKCIVTNIDKEILLVASHIKPWAVSNNKERLDINNGLLLVSHIDKLFDSGLITFNNNGQIRISSFVGKENEERLNLKLDTVAKFINSKDLFDYLEYHRDMIFTP